MQGFTRVRAFYNIMVKYVSLDLVLYLISELAFHIEIIILKNSHELVPYVDYVRKLKEVFLKQKLVPNKYLKS